MSLRKFALPGILLIAVGTLFAFKLDYFEINKQLDIFANLYREVNLYYVDETNPGELMEDAIGEMLGELDPYTVYIPERKIENFRMMQTGQYGGIGSTIRVIGDYVAIAMPYEGFAADKAGLKSGDLILSIDGKDMKGKTTEDVSSLLKGSPGTTVELKWKHGDEVITKKITREEIKVKSVPYYGMIDQETGYIILTSFTESASKEVSEAFLDLQNNHGMKKLIFDLRGNPGGLLSEAINVSNIFIPKGEKVVSTKGRLAELDKTYLSLRNPLSTDIPLVVLINRGSASASEIVSGTIQDLDRGVVMGQRSYGKGLVQQTRELAYGSQVKITIAKYYTPSGRCIQAINYADRHEDGSVSRLPDSLRTAYHTRAGRLVYDGGGIDPDLELSTKEYSNVLVSLIRNGHIFNYATEWVLKNKAPENPGDFHLTDEQYSRFVKYLDDKHYTYETATEAALEKLKKVATNEEYQESIAAEIEALESALAKSKKDDLSTYRAQIKEELEREIIGRYYYQSGQIAFGTMNDPSIKEAIKVLNDQGEYAKVLGPNK